MKKIFYYLSKLFPLIGLMYNKIRYSGIHFEIGLFMEINVTGTFSYGRNLRIGQQSRIDILGKNQLDIGNDVEISRNTYLYPVVMKIGNRTRIQDNVRIYGSVDIGNDVIIAPNVFISSSSHIFSKEEGLTIREQDKKYEAENKCIIIEDDCWIGTNVAIMPSVTIAKGCVIGANSVITKDTLEYGVYAGVPARRIKNRYDEKN